MIARRPHYALIALLVVALVCLATLLNLEQRRTELRWRAGFLPGNPRRGGELFQDRGCARCHSISGVGGKIARDLSRPQKRPLDLAEVAAAMWNHAPEMWEEMAAQSLPLPRLAPSDVSDLLAFLFAAGYLEEEGSPERGEAVLATKGCLGCHLTAEGRPWIVPDLTRWSTTVNPILFSQLLWNHGPAMEVTMKERGISWPRLETQELIDLLSYLRSVGTEPRRRAPLPGDPVVGRAFFRSYCQQCHKAEGRGGSAGPELGPGPAPRTLAALAASLWNHSPAMGERMKELGVTRPSFTEIEMAHLVAYLFAARYFEARGDAALGRIVYQRSCLPCHGPAGQGGAGPPLGSLGVRASPTFMCSTLWNHGPPMYQEMKNRGLSWPALDGAAMRNLIEYLRTLS